MCKRDDDSDNSDDGFALAQCLAAFESFKVKVRNARKNLRETFKQYKQAEDRFLADVTVDNQRELAKVLVRAVEQLEGVMLNGPGKLEKSVKDPVLRTFKRAAARAGDAKLLAEEFRDAGAVDDEMRREVHDEVARLNHVLMLYETYFATSDE